MKLATINEMKELDSNYINQFMKSQILLMENASLSAFYVINRYFNIKDSNFHIFCGPGNNGGDALALARKLFSYTSKISIYILADKNKYSGATKENLSIISRLGIPICDDIMNFHNSLDKNSIIIDGIFGIGLNRDVGGVYKEVINLINSQNSPIISLDIPSGINGDTGQTVGTSIVADYTISFGVLQPGHFIYPAYKNCGKILNSRISFPLGYGEKLKLSLNSPTRLSRREEDGHKGSFGKALFICGSHNYFGAPYFSSYSFLKAGGGYSTLFSTKDIILSTIKKAPELVVSSSVNNSFTTLEDFPKIKELASKNDFIVLGCGIGLKSETKELAFKIIREIQKPLILDGDALTMISEDLSVLLTRKAPTILTPHLKEFSNLSGKSISEIKKDTLKAIREFCEGKDISLILKGANTIIYHSNGEISFNLTGNSGMGKAGSGDVLVGVISAMLANHSLKDAINLGVFLHGYSGDLLKDSIGEDGYTPLDLMNNLPRTLKYYRENYKKIISSFDDFDI